VGSLHLSSNRTLPGQSNERTIDLSLKNDKIEKSFSTIAANAEDAIKLQATT